MHVRVNATPAGLPSIMPVCGQAGSHVLDPARLGPADARVVDALRARHRPMVLPTATQLGDAAYFILRGAG